MKELKISGDGSKWGISDLYSDVQEQLENAWNTSFKVTWASKKSLASAGIEKTDKIKIWVGCSCDEDFDLIEDAFWHFKVDTSISEWEKIESIFEEIYETAINMGSVMLSEPWFYESKILPKETSLEICLTKLDKLHNIVESRSSENFQNLCSFIEPYVEAIQAIQEQEQMEE